MNSSDYEINLSFILLDCLSCPWKGNSVQFLIDWGEIENIRNDNEVLPFLSTKVKADMFWLRNNRVKCSQSPESVKIQSCVDSRF